MKLGDIVINPWAGNKNPHKVLMFLRQTKRKIYCLALDGEVIEFNNDKDSGLKVKDKVVLDKR